MTPSLNVVIVASDLPYPPTAGNRIRTLNLVLRLAERHQITLVTHRNTETKEATDILSQHGIETILVNRSIPAKSGPLFYGRLAANLMSPLPYSVSSHSSWPLRMVVQDLSRQRRVDLWQVEATALIDALADRKRAPNAATSLSR